MNLSTILAAIVLNKTICMPSITIGSNPAYNALYEIEFCWDNEPDMDAGQDNTFIVGLTCIFD